MDTQPTSFKDELASALDWWRGAGVDCEFTDDATAWLGREAEKAGGKERDTVDVSRSPPKSAHKPLDQPQPQKVERVDLLGPNPPETLEAFHTFWMEAPGLDAIGPRGRVSPRGAQNAKLMVLVTEPEEGDRTRLLDGLQGELLNAILRAMGVDENAVYIASALPRHTPMADTPVIAANGMDAVTLHHIKLAAPKAVLAMGANISPLIGAGSPKEAQSLREINLTPSPTPVLIADGLDSLLAMPRRKARFWRRWIEWSAENL